jgi:ABC-2 type transport system permease protein
LHSVFERTFHEHRRSVLVWSAGLFVLAVVMAALYPTIRDNPQLATLHETYPKALRSLFGISDLTTGIGFMRDQVFSLVAPLLLIVLAVLWGSDLIAGEEDRRTIDILLANPISRGRVLAEKWAALAVGVAVTGAALAAGLAVAIPVVDLDIRVAGVAAAVVSVVVLGLLFGIIALAVGAATGRRGTARGAAAVLAVAAYLVSSLSDLVGWIKTIRPLSPWYHALGVDPLANGFGGAHLLVPLGLTALVMILAVFAFDRRDLAV